MDYNALWDDDYDVLWNDYGNYMRWQLWCAMKWLRELHEMTSMMCHEMTRGTTWDDDYDAPWNGYRNYIRWRLWCAMKWLWELHKMTIIMCHEMTMGTTGDDKYDAHEMTMGTTWDDNYDAPWNDYGNYGITWEHAKVTRNYTAELDIFQKNSKICTVKWEAWFFFSKL
jgi:hypothetical protein